jgi:beta-glucuronidase
MLAPRDTPTRERKSLNALWRFALDAARDGRAEGWWMQPLAGSRERRWRRSP